MEDYIPEQITAFNLRFMRPSWWKFRLEKKGEREAYVFGDVYIGTLRITPFRIGSASFELDAFLNATFMQQRAHAPEWKLFNGRQFICYAEDGEDATRLHFYITGHGDTVVVCSFAYLSELLNDEFSADEVASALEDVVKVLESMTFN